VRLVIVGSGPAEPRLRKLMPSAVFLGQHRGEQLARIFASLDVFVHSGCHETFGQTIQEAAASGLPVVAPAVGGPVDLVEDGVTGCLVTPGDRDALTSATQRLAADPLARAVGSPGGVGGPGGIGGPGGVGPVPERGTPARTRAGARAA
jgi:phosphatidylinositol alpha 1,6-mannosyltransferase